MATGHLSKLVNKMVNCVSRQGVVKLTLNIPVAKGEKVQDNVVGYGSTIDNCWEGSYKIWSAVCGVILGMESWLYIGG